MFNMRTNKIEIIIVASAVLMATLSYAMGADRSQGKGNVRSSSVSKPVSAAPASSRMSSKPASSSFKGNTQSSSFRSSSPSIAAKQSTPVFSNRSNAITTISRPSVSQPQIRQASPSRSTTFSSSSSKFSQPATSFKAEPSRQTTSVIRSSGVSQVKTSVISNPSLQRQATVKNDVVSSSRVIKESSFITPKSQTVTQTRGTLSNSGGTISSDRAVKIGSTIQTTELVSNPVIEQQSRVSKTIDVAKTSRIVSELVKTTRSEPLVKNDRVLENAKSVKNERITTLQSQVIRNQSQAKVNDKPQREGETKSDVSVSRQDATKQSIRQPDAITRDFKDAGSDTRKDSREKTAVTDRISGDKTPTGEKTIRRSYTEGKSRRDGEADKTTINTNKRSTEMVEDTGRGTKRFRDAHNENVGYEDRSSVHHDGHHYDHVYRDRHNHLCHRAIWPTYSFGIYYGWGPYYTWSYAYPYYCNRYVFVSLGGYWPEDYSYVRYYWYPSHFYGWYGYDPVAYEAGGDTYNYYTYNYYGSTATDSGYSNTGVDENTYADVRQNLANQQQAPPAAETPADTYFDEGVKAFEKSFYALAADKFAKAKELAPEDMIVPFAYAQALFADGKYYESADALRAVLENVTPEKQGVFYPRGLYLDENILIEQIDKLSEESQKWPADSDLQLLLGYQLLGIGETEQALAPLTNAKQNGKNFAAATVLIELAEKVKAGNTSK